MTSRKWTLGVLMLSLAGGSFSGAQAPGKEPGKRDAKAEQVAAAMMQAMGGEQAWKAAHFIRYDFNVIRGGKPVMERSHLWDKWSGRHRLERKTKEGKSEVILFTDANARRGAVYREGVKLDGPEAEKSLLSAHAAYINDMYWLAMPWKWMDPGVNLKYLGPKTRGNETYDVVELTFGNVGLTPGDKYRAFVSRSSHLMTHWEYTLQSKDKGSWDWQYGDYQGIKLASNHTNAQKASINMGDVRVLDNAEDAFFADPRRPLAQLK